MPDEGAAPKEAPRKRSRLTGTLALVFGVAIVEGAGFWLATKIFGGGPQIAYGEGAPAGNVLEGQEVSPTTQQTAEVELLAGFRVPNDKRGRLYIYDFDLALKTRSDRAEEVKTLIEARKREICDRIARIVRAAEPEVLHEPDLKTIRMQIQHALGEILGDQELIVEVLIPRCVPLRSA